MSKITVSAKTYDEAITKALIELQTTSDHLRVKVIEEGSNGLFGLIGAKKWTIEASVKSEEEEALEEARKVEAEKKAALEAAKKAETEKAALEAAKKAEAEKAALEAAKKAEAEKAALEAAKKAEAEKAALEAAKKEEASVSKADEEEISEKEDNGKHRRRQRNGRKEGGRGFEASRTEVREERSARRHEEAGREVFTEEAEEIKGKAVDFLTEVFHAMNEEISIDTDFNYQDNELSVLMSGDNMGVLIGKRGQTLDSLQYLVSLVVNKHRDVYIRVKLDTENYRERREQKLRSLARTIAHKVKRSRKPVSLEPMNPYERRVIHSALQRDPYVTTYSEGEEPYRHIVVVLKRESGRGRKRDWEEKEN